MRVPTDLEEGHICWVANVSGKLFGNRVNVGDFSQDGIPRAVAQVLKLDIELTLQKAVEENKQI